MFKKKLTRSGACLSCGECCKVLRISVYLNHSLRQHGSMEDLERYYAYRGFRLINYSKKDDFINFEADIPCDKLTADNKCLVHGTDEKPLLCRTYPSFKDNIEKCGFTFKETYPD